MINKSQSDFLLFMILDQSGHSGPQMTIKGPGKAAVILLCFNTYHYHLKMTINPGKNWFQQTINEPIRCFEILNFGKFTT